MVKNNKYSYDKMRVEMTDGKSLFFLLKAMCLFCQIPHSLKGQVKKVKRFREKNEEKV